MAGGALIGNPSGLLSPFLLDPPFSVSGNSPGQPSELYTLSSRLQQQWAAALLALQVTDRSHSDDYGGIWCPADQAVHGRSGDAIYPFFQLAATTKNSKYSDAALLLYRWMERRVSQADGSWLNEPQKGSWQGTTVFSAISLGETLKNHGGLMDPAFRQELRTRLHKAGDYIHKTFTIDYGNINYPISASYGLLLLGDLLDVPEFKEKGKDLAHQALRFISSKDGFLSGEGDPYYQSSKKGCFSVDLGYNVEESLPALSMYGLMAKDEEVLQAVTRSLQTHMEFLLPDGGWDNSWGTRNYKWTYWGSRTSDGCQTAYALLAHRDPVFYKAALQNTRLLQKCTKEGLLNGGLHNHSRGVPVCVHHTFSHIKALTTIQDYPPAPGSALPATTLSATTLPEITLPREKIYGSRFFSDIQTWLLSKGGYRATVTGYDREYKKTKNGHASGGALTLLWHERTGPLLAGSMNEYQLFEAGNMQPDKDPFSMPLTPRIEYRSGGSVYMNSCDLEAVIEVEETPSRLVVHTRSALVDKDQQHPPSGEIRTELTYAFTDDKVIFQFNWDKAPPTGPSSGQPFGHPAALSGQPAIIFPLISPSGEPFRFIDPRTLLLDKGAAKLKLSSDHPILLLPSTGKRIFNFVPGLEAIPLRIDHNNTRIELEIL